MRVRESRRFFAVRSVPIIKYCCLLSRRVVVNAPIEAVNHRPTGTSPVVAGARRVWLARIIHVF